MATPSVGNRCDEGGGCVEGVTEGEEDSCDNIWLLHIAVKDHCDS